MSETTYCDWLTAKQHHDTDQPQINGGLAEHFNESGEPEFPVLKFKILEGLHDTSMQIRSDGRTVEARGNIGKFNQPDNVHGISLDECKIKLNSLLAQYNLAPFTDAKTVLLAGRKKASVISGATISRIDMMQDFTTGSPHRRNKYLQWLNTRTHPTLKLKTVYQNGNMYFGKGEGTRSQTRLIRIYDKALEIFKKLKRDSDNTHLNLLAKQLDRYGVFRIEQEFHKYLKANGLNLWQNATSATLGAHLQKDLLCMTQSIETEDLEKIPKKLLGTLLMYLHGINPREKMSRNIFAQHNRELKALGYDVSNMDNVERLKLPQMTITPVPLRRDQCLGDPTQSGLKLA